MAIDPSLYGDPTPASAAKPDAQPDAEPKGDDNHKSFLVPKDICPDEMKPGDEFTVKVEEVLEDQYSLSYLPEPKQEEEAKPEMPMAGPPKGGGMGGLYE
jgi:hypothetical protein